MVGLFLIFYIKKGKYEDHYLSGCSRLENSRSFLRLLPGFHPTVSNPSLGPINFTSKIVLDSSISFHLCYYPPQTRHSHLFPETHSPFIGLPNPPMCSPEGLKTTLKGQSGHIKPYGAIPLPSERNTNLNSDPKALLHLTLACPFNHILLRWSTPPCSLGSSLTVSFALILSKKATSWLL